MVDPTLQHQSVIVAQPPREIKNRSIKPCSTDKHVMGKFLFLDENSTYFVVRFRWLMITPPYFAWFCFHPIWKPVSLGIIIPKLSEHVESWSHQPIADTKLVSGICQVQLRVTLDLCIRIPWHRKTALGQTSGPTATTRHPALLAKKGKQNRDRRSCSGTSATLSVSILLPSAISSAMLGAPWHLQFLHWRSCNLHGIVFSESISHVSLLGPWNYPIPWNCWNSMPSGAFRYFATFDFATFRIGQTDWHRRSGGLLCCFLVIFPRGLLWGYQNYQRQEDINDFFLASRLNSNHLIVEISMALGGIRRYWLWILCVSGWNLVSQHGSTNPCDLSRVKNWKDHWILLLAEIQLLWPTRNLLMF